jgi:hypothetical protein
VKTKAELNRIADELDELGERKVDLLSDFGGRLLERATRGCDRDDWREIQRIRRRRKYAAWRASRPPTIARSASGALAPPDGRRLGRSSAGGERRGTGRERGGGGESDVETDSSGAGPRPL